jgi:ParB family chromosome partitioning protein
MSQDRAEGRGLGRGLSALMSDIRASAADASPGESRRAGLSMVGIECLRPNPRQPRRAFPADALEELAESIRRKGILQPLIVRTTEERDRFEIVAGERRWRAAQAAGLHEVPALVRDYSDLEVLEIGIIENIQRAELDPIDEALAFQRLIQEFGHTQEQVAETVAKSRSYLANALRLLKLPEPVQNQVKAGKLSAGHARALVVASDPVALAAQVVGRGLSVRQTEDLVREEGRRGIPGRGRRKPQEKDPDTRALEADLSSGLRMGVSITHNPDGSGGRLTVTYRSLDQLDLLCRALSGAAMEL